MTRSFAHSLAHSLFHALAHSRAKSLNHSLTHLLIHTRTRLLKRSVTRSITRLLTRSLTQSMKRSVLLIVAESRINDPSDDAVNRAPGPGDAQPAPAIQLAGLRSRHWLPRRARALHQQSSSSDGQLRYRVGHRFHSPLLIEIFVFTLHFESITGALSIRAEGNVEKMKLNIANNFSYLISLDLLS